VAYRADIEIGVKGARSLEQLRSSINQTAQAVSSLNDVVSARGSLVQSIQNYVSNLNTAARSLQLVGAGTEAETKAVREYVRALGEANTARARQNSLVAQEIANQRRVTPGNAGVGQQGPALPPALIRAQQVQQGWNRFFQEAAEVAQELQSSAAARSTNLKTNWNRFFQEAVEVAEDLKNTAKARGLNTRTSWTVFFQEAADTAKSIQATIEQKAALVKSSWSTFFDDAAQVAEDLRARTAQIRSREAAASSAARQRLAQAANQQAGEVVRRPIAGSAYAEPAGPGGAGVTRASAVAAEASLRKTLDLQLKTAAAAGSWATALQTGSRWLNEDLEITSALLRANDQLLKSTNAQTAARKQLAKVKAFESQQTNRAKRTEQLNESIALGVGFPLLFGGGAGSIAGSFAGSFAGKGFGGQIIGGAIGQVIDDFVVGLTKVTSSLEETTKAAGISGTALEKNIEALKKAEQEEKAMELATQALARVVGEDGVRALSEFERAGTQLANAFQKLGVQLQALAADLLGPTAAGIAGAIEDTVLIRQAEKSGDPRQIADIQARNKAFGDEYYAIQERILNRQRRINAEFENQTVLIEESVNTSAQDVRVLRTQIELAKTDGDLTNDKVFKLREILIQKEFEKALQDAINNGTSSEVAQLERKLKLTQLATDRQEAFAKAAEKAAKAGRDQLDVQKALLGLQAELIRTTLEAGDLDIQSAQITQGRAAALDEELNQLQARLDLEARALELRLQQQLLTKDLTAQERSLLETIYKEQVKNLTQQYNNRQQIAMQAKAQLALDKALADAEAVRQAKQPFEDVRKQRELEAQYGKTYLRLVTEGMLPAEAERIANYERLTAEQIRQLDLQIATAASELKQAENRGLMADALKVYVDQLERLQKARGAAVESAALGPGEGPTDEQRAADAIAQIRGEINALTDPINAAVTGANAIGNAFQQAFQGLVTGSMTAQEALSSFFKSIGEAFVSMAAEIIAKQLVMITLQTILKSLGFAGGGGNPAGSGGNVLPGGWQQYAFAEGGFVTGPTNALIGEGNEPEYVIPASKMRTAMSRYAGGARGNNVIPGSGAEGGTEQGGVATMEPIDVRYSVERINNVDYVTADQFQRGMARAAQQGAIQGERRAMRSLKNSSATRRSVGI
jgi:hypothetical protein